MASIVHAVGKAGQFKPQFDALFGRLPIAWPAGFEGRGSHLDYYLKAYRAPVGILIQIALGSALTRRCRANVMWV